MRRPIRSWVVEAFVFVFCIDHAEWRQVHRDAYLDLLPAEDVIDGLRFGRGGPRDTEGSASQAGQAKGAKSSAQDIYGQ